MKKRLNKILYFLLICLMICLFGCSELSKDISGELSKDADEESSEYMDGVYYPESGLDVDTKNGIGYSKGSYTYDGGYISSEKIDAGYLEKYAAVIDIEDSLPYYPWKNNYRLLFSFPYLSYDYMEASAGLLTGSVVFDNDNYSQWLSYIKSGQEEKGIFKDYHDDFAFKTDNRLKIKVDGIKGAKVTLLDDGFTTYTDANGLAYIYPKTVQESYVVNISFEKEDGELFSSDYEVNDGALIVISEKQKENDLIELMFVVDTTGSMSDEISFLKAEIDDVISKVKESNPNAQINIALLFYRDKGDEYVTRYYGFDNQIDKVQDFLCQQRSSGGGDFEEAVYQALGEACDKNWSEEASTKLIIHVADAPSHDNEINEWSNNVKRLTEKGIKIITVASSGINKKTEYFFRSQSMISGGAYVYLTDDSGIGLSHIEATTEVKPIVEYLNKLLVRLINGYYNGDFGVAEPYKNVFDYLPTQLPEDFNFVLTYTSKENKYVYDSKEHSVIFNKTTYSDVKLDDNLIATIYEDLKEVDIDKISEFDESNHYIQLDLSYGETNITIKLNADERDLINKVDSDFYSICLKIFYAVNKEFAIIASSDVKPE